MIETLVIKKDTVKLDDDFTTMYIKHINNGVDILTELSESPNPNNHTVRLMQIHCKQVIDRAKKLEGLLEEKLEDITSITKRAPKILAQGELKV